MAHYDVLVVGGGVVGLSAAIGMRSRGYTVAIIDAAGGGSLNVRPSLDARVYALNHPSLVLLEQQGVLTHIDSSYLSAYRHMHVWDHAQKAQIDFDARLIGEASLGVIVSDSALKQALHRQCDAQGIPFFASTVVNDLRIDSDGVSVYAENTLLSRLLIVADGARSTVRELLGVKLTTWPYEQTAIVAHVQTEKPHEHTAYQVFRNDGPLAFLPLSDPYQCSIVWSTATAHAEVLMEMTADDFTDALTDAFEHKLGACCLLGQRYAFPLVMRQAQTYAGPRWLLMGDAAHTIHPLAGLGLNLGLADVATWLRLCDNRAQPLSATKRLGQYQRERKMLVWQTILAMEGLKTLFGSSLAPVVALRGLGLSLCNGQSLLKRFFIHQAQSSCS